MVLRATTSSARAAWSFFTQNFDTLASRFAGGQSFIIAGIVKGVTAGFKTNEEADEIEAFFRTNPIPSAQRAVAQSIEGIRGKAKFIQIAKASLEEFLTKA